MVGCHTYYAFYFYGIGVYYVNFVGNINIDDKLIDNLKCASNIYCFFGDVEILSWISHITHESLHHYLLQSGCLASLILETNLRKFRYLIFFRFYYLLVFAYIFLPPLPTQYLVISASPSVPAPCRRWPACWPGPAGGSPYHEGQHRICRTFGDIWSSTIFALLQLPLFDNVNSHLRWWRMKAPP